MGISVFSTAYKVIIQENSKKINLIFKNFNTVSKRF